MQQLPMAAPLRNPLSPIGASSRRIRLSWRSIGLFSLVSLFVTLLIYLSLRQIAISQTEEHLRTVSHSKSLQLSGWLLERRGDAEIISHGPYLSQSLIRLRRNRKEDVATLNQMRSYLKLVQQSYQYTDVYILKPDGSYWLSTQDPAPQICPEELEEIQKLSSQSPPQYFSLCHRADSPIYQDLIFPVFDSTASPPELLAFGILRIDPHQYLFSLLRSWPFESDTAETLLISRAANEPAILLDLKLHPEMQKAPSELFGTPLDSLLSLAQVGFEGFRLGRDQDNHPAYSYSQKIPDVPWTLMVKIDQAEALRGLGLRTGFVAGSFLLLLLTSLGLLHIWSQKESTQRLQESEENFRGMISRMQDAFLRTSIDNGTILYCNPYAVKLLGYSSEKELIGQPMSNWLLYSNWDRESLLRTLESEGEIPSHINTWKTKQGKPIPIDAYVWLVRDDRGRPLYIESLSRDATNRFRMEQELRQEKDKAQTFLNVAGVMIIALDANQKVSMINKKGCEILGYTESEVLGRNWFDDFKRGDQSEIKAKFNGIFKSNSRNDLPPDILESEVVTKSGETKLISWHISILRDENNSATGVLLSGEDITEKKNMELRLVEAMYEAKAATAAKSDFLANMSHEIRTPLNAIIGLARIALRSVNDFRQRDLLRKISQASESLLSIINDILDFSKVEAGKVELESVTFDLSQVFNRVSDLTSYRAEEKGLQLDLSIASEIPPYLVGDPLRLSQILLNLTTNAIKFSDQGKILVRARLLGQKNSQARVEFTVHDMGIGMSKAQQDKLFQSFSQTDYSISRKYGGTGLGLAICKRLTDLMGGEISVSSEPGIGSTFRVELSFPIASAASIAQVMTVPTSSKEDILFPGVSILVVEDNEINQLVARDVLEQFGALVTVAASGDEALHLLNEPGQKFQAVLMDLQMPGIDGYQTTLKIRQNPAFSNLPIIAMTAHVLNAEKAKCFEIGMNDYVSKPIDPASLRSVLRKWIPITRASISTRGAEPVIDHERALHRFAGRKAFYIKLLNLFASSYLNVASDLRLKMDQSDFAAARLMAHSLRGAAGNISALQVVSVATEIEDLLDHNELSQALNLLNSLDQAIQKVLQEINVYVQNEAPTARP